MIGPNMEPEYYDEVWDRGQIGPEDHYSRLYKFLGMQQTDEFVLIYESFEFRNLDRRERDNINLISREYIGVIKLFAEARMLGRPDQRLIRQKAADAKGFIPDKGAMANKKLKDAGLWYPNSKHAMDATRHLLYYLVARDQRMDLVRRWWRK
jgi:hypothetical protein